MPDTKPVRSMFALMGLLTASLPAVPAALGNGRYHTQGYAINVGADYRALQRSAWRAGVRAAGARH